MKLGHIHLKVRDLDTSVTFYRSLFGLEVTEQVEQTFAFMTGNDMHHQLALQARGPAAKSPDPGTVGLFHVAFEVPDKKAFAEKYRQLLDMDVKPYTIDHIISWAMYFDDPDGNGLEIYVDTRGEPDGNRAWEGVNRPLSEERILEFGN